MRAFYLLTVIGVLLFMARGITGPIGSLYAESLGANYASIGLLSTTAALAGIIANVAWGALADRSGRRKPILIAGLWLLAVSEIGISLSPRYHYLYLGYALSAIAQSAYATASLALIGDLLESQNETRGRYMGIYRGLASLGFGLMALNAGALADKVSFRAPFATAGALALAGALLGFLTPESRYSQPASISGGSLKYLLRERLKAWKAARRGFIFSKPSLAAERGLSIAPLLISAALWSLVTGAVYAVWANYMVTEAGYSPTTMSRLWALASLSEFPLMMFAGWLSDRIGRLETLSLGFIAWSIVFSGYIITPAMPWIIGIQLVRGLAFSAYTTAAMTYAAEVRGQIYRGRIAGWYGSASGIGSILGGVLGGGLAQWLGFRPMFAINALLILLGAVYVGIVALQRRAKNRAVQITRLAP